ncbi:MAG: hypothetical protein ABIP65_07520 [Vicinamibacterales bacterium]
MIQEFLHLFAPLTANCKDFTHRWERAAALDADSVSGRWEGEWISEATGHRGPLRAVLTVIAPALWRVSFRASYSGMLRACYATDFNVSQQDGRWRFSGGSDLGAIAGGRYEYAGSATLTEMACTYKSSRDHGEFRLQRPA